MKIHNIPELYYREYRKNKYNILFQYQKFTWAAGVIKQITHNTLHMVKLHAQMFENIVLDALNYRTSYH